MAKSFKTSMGIDSLFSPEEQESLPKRGRPVGTGKPENKKKVNKTWQVNSDLVTEVKMIASREGYRLTMESGTPVKVADQDIVESALKEYIAKYNKKYPNT